MEAIDDKEFGGSIVTLLQNGEEFVTNNSKKRWKKTANGRIEMPDYPERAVFEGRKVNIELIETALTEMKVNLPTKDKAKEVFLHFRTNQFSVNIYQSRM